MNRLSFKHLLAFALIASSVVAATGQARMPTEITSSTIREQIQYVEDHTRIYENYRAIREDIYQKVNRNFLDTLKAEKTRIAELNNLTADLVSQTDSLGVLIEETRARLEEVTATKNSAWNRGEKESLQHNHVDAARRIGLFARSRISHF